MISARTRAAAAAAGSALARGARPLSKTPDAQAAAGLPSSADVVVIGGGSVGAATCYHLQAKGLRCVLLEAHSLTAGTTWHTAGMLWRLRPSYVEVELNSHTRDMCQRLEAETGERSWTQNGGLFVATTRERLAEYERLAETGRYYGIEGRVLTPAETKEVHPLLDVGDVVGALHSPSDGTIDADAVVRAYAKGARAMGAVVQEGVAVEGLDTEECTSVSGRIDRRVTGVRVAGGHSIGVHVGVVNSCGAWANAVAGMAGVRLPLLAMKHAYIVTEALPGMHGGLPNVRDHDLSIYLKAQGSALAIGGYETNPEFWHDVDPAFAFGLFDLDWDTFAQNMDGHFRRCPAVETAGIASTVCGPESFTPDHKPLVGPQPGVRGLWHSCGYNSAGIMLAGGVARELAAWVADGAPTLDMFAYDCARFHPDAVASAGWVRDCTHEAYAKNYAIVFPHDEPLAGRGLRRSALHAALAAKGCVHQARHGFERPGWFDADALPGDTQPLPYDYYGAYPAGDAWRLLPPGEGGASAGWPAHTRHPYRDRVEGDCTFTWPASHAAVSLECAAARTGVAIFDQSYFGKLEVRGPDAEALLQWVCAADVAMRPEGAVTYSPLCNERGGVEADLTVTRLPNTAGFYVCTGGATATKDRARIEAQARDLRLDVAVEDRTGDVALISVQGPWSRALLAPLVHGGCLDDLDRLPFSHMADVLVAGAPARCLRLTFVGELGYELHVRAEDAGRVYAAVRDAGAVLEKATGVPVRDAGYHAIDSLSAEKGFRHYHADLGAGDTPFEAGIGFTVTPRLKREASGDFLGRAALERERAAGLRRRLVCLAMDDAQTPLHGSGATVWRDGACVGVVRLSAFAHTLGTSLAYAYVEASPGTPKAHAAPVTTDWLRSGEWHVGDRGTLHPATLHLRAPFDPANARVRGEYPDGDFSGLAAASGLLLDHVRAAGLASRSQQ